MRKGFANKKQEHAYLKNEVEGEKASRKELKRANRDILVRWGPMKSQSKKF